MPATIYRVFAMLALAGGALMVTACASSPPSRLYVLSPIRSADAGASAPAAGTGPVIGIGPITVPEYLDQPQIVVQASAYRFELAEGHRWAEPLQENLRRVLMENLSLLMGTDRIETYPWRRSPGVEFQIAVEIIEFNAATDNLVTLAARWSVRNKNGAMVVPIRRSQIRVPASAPDYEAIVAAHSEALARLSREIATEMRRAMGSAAAENQRRQ
jgi:uncharacterized lipoprotein YmbA